MKRYVLLFFIMLSALNTYAQSNMSDSQVMEFIVKEHNKGNITSTNSNKVDAEWCRYLSNKKSERHIREDEER